MLCTPIGNSKETIGNPKETIGKQLKSNRKISVNVQLHYQIIGKPKENIRTTIEQHRKPKNIQGLVGQCS